MPDRPPPVDLLEFVGDAGRRYVLTEPAAPVAPDLPVEPVEPVELHHLAGDPERRYVEPIGSGSSNGRQRAWLACVLVIALVLPALVVTFGYNRGAEPAEALAAPASTDTQAEATTSDSIATTVSSRKRATTTTTEEPTTTASTEAPTTTTTWATTSTSAAPVTSTTAYAVVAQAAPATTAAPTTTTTAYVAPPTTAPNQGEAAFLACVRMRESGGNYGAVSSDGQYRGAYQFHQSTWNSVASMAGRPDLIGVLANLASPADQDLLAVTLYRYAGTAPWGGSCG